ncbi:DUF1266 domain-containing protein [Pseudoflavonifractor phocaeensis]|uniref:DUF1266 domain-containing protein n=1 Tax=Pseudoflavonifractor phocaeensis TaxID=1870988 RepID=UPI00210C693D|nr:DUF1266 domain-containing protein [Pseudoflavonifractor phocaeensis]MCQ4863333.1 DUF1266 domain-containing protein [Pseudoflavonifractor phocaeensis]
MVDLDEIRKRAQAAAEKATGSLQKSMEESNQQLERMRENLNVSAEPDDAAQDGTAQSAADAQRQVELLGQMFSPEMIQQLSVTEEMIRQTVDRKVAEAAALGVDGFMSQMFGEDMGIISAALETLAMEDEEDASEEQELDLALEQELYTLLDQKLAQIEALPEAEPVTYPKNTPQWKHFGILLSGIISSLNNHELDGMDVEQHTPVMEQQIVSLVRRSWGINGRSELLDTIRYLSREGYELRYQIYCDADTVEQVPDESVDEEDRESACRGWRFAQHYKARYVPGFMTGWDVGRAAMLARWGCYLGWITEGEAEGILWELSQRAEESLHSWREFASSYLFGGLMWKLLCGDSAAESYLGYLTDAAIDLLTGKPEDNEGQWKECPWPGARKIGFQG